MNPSINYLCLTSLFNQLQLMAVNQIAIFHNNCAYAAGCFFVIIIAISYSERLFSNIYVSCF